MKHSLLILAIFIVFVLTAFQLRSIKIWPSYFPDPHYSIPNQKEDSLKIAYGRMLFYDPILSKDNSISCASCHSPYNAFAHTDHELSHGIGDSIGLRNAPALFNLAWQKELMWDGAVNHIDMQALAPLESKSEMGETLENVVRKLNKHKFYRSRTFEIYGDSVLNGAQLLKLLSSFQLTLQSYNSKYDKVRLGIEKFNEQELNGYQLFKTNCDGCHTEPLFSNYKFERNFLPLDSVLNDVGRFRITQIGSDSLKFKVPSLRNLSYSFPYTHDGRFNSLYEMINHYTSETTNKNFKVNDLKPIILTENEKVDLVSFLLTINDKDFVFSPKHQFPKELLNK